MKYIYLVYAYFSDINAHIMMRACSSKKKAEEYKESLLKHNMKGLHSVRIEKETIY